MKSSLHRCAVGLAAAGACALASTGTAMAATTPFGCTASVARATSTATSTAFGTIPSESEAYDQANAADTPCATDAATTGPESYNFDGVSLSVQQAGAYTGSSTSFGSTADVAPSAGATAAIDGATLTYPGTDGQTQTVTLTPSDATATDVCLDGAAIPTGVSSVADVLVNGQSALPYSSPTATTTVNLPDSNGSYIVLNLQTVAGGTLTQDAALVHLAGIGDIAIEEASVTAGTCPSVTLPGIPPISVCPTGSTFEPTTLLCEILSTTSGTVPVSEPYQGPTGGVVIPLAAAQKLYPGNPCLSGPGPDYAIVATPTARVLNGTKGPDRMLGLNYNVRLAGLAGNDCLSAGNGTDLLYDSQGDDRVTAGNGKDRVGFGNGNDTIAVGSGKDWVTAGRGNDTVTVGTGTDRIDLGHGKDVVKTGKGKDRVYTASTTAQVTCVNKKDLAYLTKAAAKFAKKHGCEVIRVVK